MSDTALQPQSASTLTQIQRFACVADLIEAWRPRQPVYCIYPGVLAAHARRFMDGFPGLTLYAVKANPHPAIIRLLYESGVRHFDTASIEEVKLVQGLCPDASCYFMAPARLLGASQEAQARGIRNFVVDHAKALDLLKTELGSLRGLTLFVRLGAPNPEALYEFSGKFGASPAEAVDLIARIAEAGAEPALAVNVGSLVRKPDAYAAALVICDEVLRQCPHPIRLLDIGGGFPSRYPGLEVSDLEEFFTTIRTARETLPLAAGAALLGEPGRALVTEGMSVLTQVILRKPDGVYLNDGVYGSFGEPLQSKGKVHYPLRAYRSGGKLATSVRDFACFGPTCDAIDSLPRPFALPEDIEAGDWIEFGSMGAYGYAMRTRFNGFHSELTAIIDGNEAAPPSAAY